MKKIGGLIMKKDYILKTNAYGNVTAYTDDGNVLLPANWVKSQLTVTQLRKLEIPTYKACIGFEEKYSRGKNYYSPILVNIIHEDFSDKENQYLKALEEKENNHKAKIVSKISVDKVAEALYVINKEAKKYRDKQNEHADNAYSYYNHYLPKKTLHYLLHQSKDKKEQLYALKNATLSKLINETSSEPIGYHRFTHNCMDCYKIGGYTFHINEHTSDNYLGTIDSLIPSKKNKSMSAKDATILLQYYLDLN